MNAPTASPSLSHPTTGSTPRARRGDAAVLAQYIQDITHSVGLSVRAAAA